MILCFGCLSDAVTHVPPRAQQAHLGLILFFFRRICFVYLYIHLAMCASSNSNVFPINFALLFCSRGNICLCLNVGAMKVVMFDKWIIRLSRTRDTVDSLPLCPFQSSQDHR